MRQLFLTALLLASLPVVAEDSGDVAVERPVAAAYTIEAGSSHLADTYLSPLRYSGWRTTLRYDRMQAMRFDPERWVMQLDFSATVDRTVNPVRNATIWYGGLEFSWGMMRRFWRSGNFSAMGGGEARINLGALYASRNGNNPVSAKGALTLGLTGRLTWRGRLGRLPLTVAWQPTLPVAGAFFAPDYGQLYYEIYKGERDGLAHAAWWGNYFRLDNALTADLHFGATSLRVGYRCNYLLTKVNDITSRMISHTAVIGVSGEWLSVNPRRRSANVKMISAL